MKQNSISIRSAVENDLVCLLLIFLLSALLMLKQLLIPGYFSVIINDTHTYSSWAWQFKEALAEGIVYPRWMSLDMWGYGSPTFIIYPPLAFFMAALFSMFTGSITTAMNLCLFVALFFSGVGMFYFVRKFYDNKTAILSALFYIAFPFNIFNLYLMGSFASKISSMWFAPILLFTYLYGTNRSYSNLLYASLCYCGLICTHIINAYMFTFVLVAFIVFIPKPERNYRSIGRMSVVIPIGVLLSSAYLLPLVFEKHLINLQGFFTKGSGVYYATHFILPDLAGEVPAGTFWPVYYKIFVLMTFGFVICTLFFYAFVLIAKKNSDDFERWKLAGLFFWIASSSIFLLFGSSSFIWESVPFFKFIHLPWRWMNITVFALAILFASFCYSQLKKERSGLFIRTFIPLLFIAFIFCDSHFIDHSNVFSEGELFPLRAGYSSTDHQLPWVDMGKLDIKSGYERKLDVAEGQGRAQAVVWKSAERVIEVQAAQPLILRIRTFNFPGWKGYLDGRVMNLKTENKTGAILVDVPKGNHRVKLVFGDTPVRLYGKIISLLSLFSLLLIVFMCKRERTV